MTAEHPRTRPDGRRRATRIGLAALGVAAIVAVVVCSIVAAMLFAGPLLSGASPDDADDADVEAEVDEADVEPVVRVDQLGYTPDETKIAVVMAGADDLRGATFDVVDDAGRIVLSGEAREPQTATAASWSSNYDTVRTLDLSHLRQAGTYEVVVHTRAAARADATSPRFTIGSAAALFTPRVGEALRFFQANRDGADVVPSVMNRMPSHLLDREATVYEAPHYDDGGEVLSSEGLVADARGAVDVEGGWFDAGDFLKFTGTTAYATGAILLAERTLTADPPSVADPDVDAADDADVDAAVVSALADEAEVGLRWLEKMWDPETATLYTQVGIGNGNERVRTDHDVWRLPEADDLLVVSPGEPDYTISHRPVFRSNEPGEPVSPALAGRVAAAFALGAQQADARGDADRAARLLESAAAVYEAADTAPAGTVTTAYPAEFYPEVSWQDDLEFGAVELATAARSLGDPRADDWQRQAGEWADAYLASDTLGTLGVADVSALAHSELLHSRDSAPTGTATGIDTGAADADLVADLRRQLDAGLEHSRADAFRAGASTLDFDSVPTTFGFVTTAELYERATRDDEYRDFATAQRNWALGSNAWGSSFMIGVGTTYPRCPEHQVADLAGAGDLVGAVVNGPNEASKLDDLNRFDTMRPCSATAADGAPFTDFDGGGSRYVDDVGAWQTVEPAIDFTAGALLAFALSATG